MIEERQCDLFSLGDEWSLCHCVSVDLHMGKGIATEFKRRFGEVEKLKSQGARVGGVAVLKAANLKDLKDLKKDQNSQIRHIFYLVTKERYFGKPTYASLRASLESCVAVCKADGVTQLAMPQIGCGLDGLSWERVFPMIKEVFAESGVSVLVCKL